MAETWGGRTMKAEPLHPDFGVEVKGVDLTKVDAERDYPALRGMFEIHSLLLFRGQSLNDSDLMRLGRMFGTIEDRKDTSDGTFVVPKVSNRQAHNLLGEASEEQLTNLRANQLWHTDSTFLPVPALANIITARVLPSSGGETELVSTRAAWRRLPDDLKARTRNAVIWHRYAHSRAKIDPELAHHEMFARWPDQAWYALWRNPITGENALYLASHAYGVDGMAQTDGQALIDRLTEQATRPEHIYSHEWQLGDVLIWDERATMHRGKPWPYEEERTLASICVSAGEDEGLGTMKPKTTRGVLANAHQQQPR